MRASKVLTLVFVLVLIGCNPGRFSRNSGIRCLSAGVEINNRDEMDVAFDRVISYIQSALLVLPGIIIKGPGGQRCITRGMSDSSISEAIVTVAHRSDEPWGWKTEHYFFQMLESCKTCPPDWRWLGVNMSLFPLL